MLEIDMVINGPDKSTPVEEPVTEPKTNPDTAPETEPKTPAKPFEKPCREPESPQHNPDSDEEYETCRVLKRSGLNADSWNPEGL
jgi:hypothetical protein